MVTTNELIHWNCRIQSQHTEIAVFLNTNNELSEREIKKAIPFAIAYKIILRNKFNPEGLRPVH